MSHTSSDVEARLTALDARRRSLFWRIYFWAKLLPGAWKAMPIGGWICAACLFVAMPLLAISSAVLATIEMYLHYRQRKTF